MKITLHLLFICLPMLCKAQKSEEPALKKKHEYKCAFGAYGFSYRIGIPNSNKVNIEYYNPYGGSRDTFTYTDKISSSPSIINLDFSSSICGRFGGGSLNIGIGPISNRNYSLGVSVYGLLRMKNAIAFAPLFGYNRFRKQKFLGTFTGENDRISFKNEEYTELNIRIKEIFHSYHYGMGVYVNLDPNSTKNGTTLYFECALNTTFKTSKKLKVSHFKNILIADAWKSFNENSDAVSFIDDNNKPLSHFFALGNLMFKVQFTQLFKW
jgi:hypothetical protein